MSNRKTLLRNAAALLGGLCLLPTPGHAQVRPSIAGLQAQIATLQSQVASGTIPNVAGFVTMDVSTPSRPTLRVAGANLQLVNGTGNTATVNGLGNLIVGYNGVRPAATPPECSLGIAVGQTECATVGGIWAVDFKSGSHNVVIGDKHNYSRFAGVVAGLQNTINGDFSSVSGGSSNMASGLVASVSGGTGNWAYSSSASISGGRNGVARGLVASVSGGDGNQADGRFASVSGGNQNTASGDYTTVSGGINNTALGENSTVSGGGARTTTSQAGWVAGSILSEQ